MSKAKTSGDFKFFTGGKFLDKFSGKPVVNKELVRLLDDLIDEVGEDEAHPLASLMEVIGVLIEKYEDENVSELSVAE